MVEDVVSRDSNRFASIVFVVKMAQNILEKNRSKQHELCKKIEKWSKVTHTIWIHDPIGAVVAQNI